MITKIIDRKKERERKEEDFRDKFKDITLPDDYNLEFKDNWATLTKKTAFLFLPFYEEIAAFCYDDYTNKIIGYFKQRNEYWKLEKLLKSSKIQFEINLDSEKVWWN